MYFDTLSELGVESLSMSFARFGFVAILLLSSCSVAQGFSSSRPPTLIEQELKSVETQKLEENSEDMPVVIAEEEPVVYSDIYMGVAHNDVPFNTFEPIENLAMGEKMAFVMYFQSWADSEIKTKWLDEIQEEGFIPFVSWEPHPFGTPFSEVVYSLKDISNGQFDEELQDEFKNIKAHDGPVFLRFAHEMNGNWYPWSGYSNGNSPEDYVVAWKHVVNLSRDAGADNIKWVWSPNAINYLEQNSIDRLYPGDDYVDYVGMVGYLIEELDTFDKRFGTTVTEIREFTELPIIITETGIIDSAENRSDLACQFINDLRASKDIFAFIWFDKNAREDWRIGTADVGIRKGLYEFC